MQSLMRRLLPVLFVLLLGTGALSASPAHAQRGSHHPIAMKEAPSGGGAVARTGKVQLGVMVVHATDSHSAVDPRLKDLTRYLSHLRFTGYSLLGTHSVQLSTKGSESFTIEGGRKVTVTMLSKDDRRVRMRVQITASKGGKLLDTTLSVNRNGTFIVAGPRYKDGILVLPLTARY